jgi:archaellum biogenesis ATPase FlaH
MVWNNSFGKPTRFANMSNTVIPQETSTKFSTQNDLLETDLEVANTTLHKIYSSVSSLNSTCSNLSDCQSEIDALIDNLSDCISNVSLEDNPEPNEMAKLVKTFKTLSIANKSLDTDVDDSEH